MFVNTASSAPSQGRTYGAYQSELYAAGMLHGIKPYLTTDPNKLEEQAKKCMSATSYAYVAGGAGERQTMESNRLAFRQWKVVPRMLRPTTPRDLSVNLFGIKYDTPIFCAPVGVQRIFHPDGEKGVAEVASEIGVPYITSTASTESMEEIAKSNGKGPRWYQLYWPNSKSITESLLKRAKDNGYTALVITLDTWALAWRPWDLDNAYVPFLVGLGNQTGFADPAFQEHFRKQSGGKSIEDDVLGASMSWVGDVFSGASHSWEDLAHVREHWDGPILLKGIQHPDDALKAWECNMDGIVVSNHGGRQLDGAIGSLTMLPEIAAAVKGKKSKADKTRDFEVLFDSGIRTGVDIMKAICLGAKAVLVGRPWVYGLGINGKKGAQDALKALLADLDQSLGLSGCKSLAELDERMIRQVHYPGDTHSSN